MPVHERIAGVDPEEIGRPTGAYRVELFDDRGRIRDRVEQANYVTPTLDEWVRWAQWSGWHRGLPVVDAGTVATSGVVGTSKRGLMSPPVLPIECIAGLSSTIAENTASDWIPGRVIGWASRWKSTVSASGPRGQINEAQCETTLDGSKFVVDFNENQGNGTFQSLAICRAAITGRPRTLLPGGRSGVMHSFPLAAQIGSAGSAGGRAFCGSDASNFYGITSGLTVKTFPFASVPAADSEGWADMSTLTASATSSPLANLTFSTGAAAGNNLINANAKPGIAAVSGDWVMSFQDPRGNFYVGRWTNAGAQTWITTVANPGLTSVTIVLAGIAIVGTNAYIVASSASASTVAVATNVYRVRLSDGVVTATYPLGLSADGIGVQSTGSITTDGTDLFLATTEGIFRMSTTGAILEALGDHVSGQATETALAPWSTSASGFGHFGATDAPRDGFTQTVGGQRFLGGAPVFGSAWSAFARPGLAFRSGKLWSVENTTGFFASIDGGNGFSRTVLASAVTKTASTTMKWTYELTFPATWRNVPAHATPPS